MTEPQPKCNNRQLLNLGLLGLIGVLALLLFFEPGHNTTPAKATLTQLSLDQINHILVKRNGQPDLELERRDAIWYQTQPYQAAANDFRAVSLARIATAESHAQYDLTAVDIKKFQLDKPAAVITFNKQLTVSLGNNEPLKRRRYMQAENKLHIVDDTFYYQLMSPATTYLSYALLPPGSKITQFELPKLKLQLKDGNWLAEPIPKNFSTDNVSNLLDEWRNAQSLEVEKYTGKALAPTLHIRINGRDKPISFALRTDQQGNYLVRQDLGLQYKLTGESLNKLLQLSPPPEALEADTPVNNTAKP
ncbi:MAG: DUF4340 domain-containing protein [Gammaproteobacteria bacterium]|nr:DUF4340 domain-containing protein [Gammaproteobacteria bacterium]MDH5653303.1 DUF4340 domain-containing protein [Gammaproteobacteria bacterium]